jgi:multidrug efflux pump subunit AcrA (membrane-fusion protein)
LIGEVFTDRKILTKTKVSGLVKNLNIAEGQHVRDGGLMVELDDLKSCG